MDKDVSLKVTAGGPARKSLSSSPTMRRGGSVKTVEVGNPSRIFWVGGLDFWFDLALFVFWSITGQDDSGDWGKWRSETCGNGKFATQADITALSEDNATTYGGTAEGLAMGLGIVILLKELLAIWIAMFVLKKAYRSNLVIQSATSLVGMITSVLAKVTMPSPSVGEASEDDPDNPSILEDINVSVGCCFGGSSLRSWWMTLCILENTVALVFAMHSIGGCLIKDTVGLIIVFGALATTVIALITRALRMTSGSGQALLPGIKRETPLFGAGEHGDLEVFENCAVLTSDLSGFTKTTKQFGIVFMASVIQRMRQISLPIAYAEKPHSVGFEADDLIIVFRDVESAFRAAAIINYLVIKNREDAPPEEVHFTPKLGGLGIHCGPKILKHKNGSQLYGATASEAYHVGEEMAEKELCISSAVYKQLAPNVQKLFQEKVYSEEDLEEHEGLKPEGPVYRRKFTEPAQDMLRALDPDWEEGKSTFKGNAYGVKFADEKDMSCLPDQMELLMQIQWPENRKKRSSGPLKDGVIGAKPSWYGISEKIKAQYEVQKVALLCDIQFSNDSSPSEQVTLEGQRERIVNAAIIPNNGVSQDDKLTMFDSVLDSTLAVIAIRRGLAKWNLSQKEDKFKMVCNGYGIHKSDCLVIPGTDVHWGYCVNAASKIGEDCGEGGEILLMDVCYKEVRDCKELKDCFWIRKELEASGNQFIAFQLNERDGPCKSTEQEPSPDEPYPDIPGGSPKGAE